MVLRAGLEPLEGSRAEIELYVRWMLLLNRRGSRVDRHAATRRLKHLDEAARIHLPRMHPHMLRHTFVTTMLDA